MKKYYCLTFILFAFLQNTCATHIVGGEFQLKHLNNYNFDLFLNLYFDDVNGNQEAKDTQVTVFIYAKSNNRLVESYTLTLQTESLVPYTNPACTNPILRTRLLRYRRTITLSANIYNQSAGYYVVWERCCRNNSISNIVNPEDTGMSFYLEFPAVRRNGSDFFNSSPAFTIPAGDYLCLDEGIFINFGATDSDGDELVYSLSDPFAGNSSPLPDLIIPPAFPGPYDPVIWETGFSAQTAIPHNVNLPQNQFSVNSQTGQLFVVPNRQGLFVFSVLCGEFRNGQKIGEVRRDFQLMVLDCPSNQSPSMQVQNNDTGGGVSFYQEGEVLMVSALTNELCFDVWLKDADANEQLRIVANGINFQPRQTLLSPSQGTVSGPQDSLLVQLCWPRCLFSAQDINGVLEAFEFDLIVSDNRCPASANDTLNVKLISEPVLEHPPIASADAPPGDAECDHIIELTVEDEIEFMVFAEDLIDNDLIDLRAVGRGFNLADVGMVFENISGQGNLQSLFSWKTDCRAIRENSNEYIIDFIATDEGFCENRSDTVKVKIILLDKPINIEGFLPPNAFTPNGDLVNDVFYMPDLPEENCLFGFEGIKVFNRWGGLVFESKDRNFSWDGNELPAGVYFYTLDYRRDKYRGSVSLIR
jgi:gliding motility-associated-like protein